MPRMRFIVISLIAFGAGTAIRFLMRPSAEELGEQAVTAWNQGNVPQAEQFARLAMGRSVDTDRARKVLIQVAAHNNSPLLHAAALASVSESSSRAARSRHEAGVVAFNHRYAAVAEHFWNEALRLDPDHIPSLDRLIGLAGLRLNHERLRRLVIARADIAPLSREMVRLLIGSEGLQRDAPEMEVALRSLVETDTSDVQSRIGHARCLNEMGQFEQARAVLNDPSVDVSVARGLRARIELALGNVEAASRYMSGSEPAEEQGDYWLTAGLIALERGTPEDALRSLRRAVEIRPLNREIRSRLAQTLRDLRKTDDDAELEDSSRAVRILQQIENLAKNPSNRWDAETIDDLIPRCQNVGADDYVRLLDEYRRRL